MPDKKRALVLSAFTDAGTGESFEKGATPMIDAGAFGNYEAAGLVGTPPATKAPAKPKAKKKAAAKPASPKPAAKAPAPVSPPVLTPAPAADEVQPGA